MVIVCVDVLIVCVIDFFISIDWISVDNNLVSTKHKPFLPSTIQIITYLLTFKYAEKTNCTVTVIFLNVVL